jgi:hypothetical protein
MEMTEYEKHGKTRSGLSTLHRIPRSVMSRGLASPQSVNAWPRSGIGPSDATTQFVPKLRLRMSIVDLAISEFYIKGKMPEKSLNG